VSMTGIMDNRLMSGQMGMDQLEEALTQVKAAAVKVRGAVCSHSVFVSPGQTHSGASLHLMLGQHWADTLTPTCSSCRPML
jgi:hypothetical protein